MVTIDCGIPGLKVSILHRFHLHAFARPIEEDSIEIGLRAGDTHRRVEGFGIVNHPRTVRTHPIRQRAESKKRFRGHVHNCVHLR